MSHETKVLIYLVEDDESVRKALEVLLFSAGMDVLAFESAKDFLEHKFRDFDACLIADVKMSGLDGLALKQELNAMGSKLPVIFITAFDTEETREKAKKSGAAGYFLKPVDDQALLDSIRWALHKQQLE